MKVVIVVNIFALLFVSSCVFGEGIKGDYPICVSTEDVQTFSQAKMFNDYKTIESLLSEGKCQFVEPGIKCAVIEKTMQPKVMVFVPYKQPITGYTDSANIQ